MRALYRHTLVLTMLGVSGCVLDRYTFNGRDGAIDGAMLDASNADSDAPIDAGNAADANDATTTRPDVAVDGGCVEGERPAQGIFVTTSAGAVNGDGSEARPVNTLAQALMLAQSNGIGTIYLDRGAHTAPASISGLTLAIRIVGGWSYTAMRWARDCTSTRGDTTIQSSTNVGLLVDDNPGMLTLQRVTVQPKSAAGPSESLIAMIVRGRSQVVLDDVALVAPDAGDASPSLMPVGANNRMCDGLSDCVGAAQQMGAMGASAATPGRDANAGVFSVMGYTPGDGEAGRAGAGAGANGGPGLVGATANNCTDCDRPASGCHTCLNNRAVQGDRGRCGCGGLPGSAGVAGRGGGSSVALLIGGNAVVGARRSALTAGRGGNGAAGSTGGAGGSGTMGTDGASRSCPTVCTITSCMSCIRTSDSPVAGGMRGGSGGAGGAGSAGGAGAGGNSHAVVIVGSAMFNRNDSMLRVGIAGASGGGSAPTGTATLIRP